ncbi:hypothetical protein BCR39DRAFT_539795 [Naematelia encephala]|uniref:Uncharacterized protein n=1 Tax=Naematelia encephala TaxID=71784 RepID=A0A1Y2AY95_9TREE|nr:hypothetical protein BCR39DRAFT_539795 [Naematelia encephala]
MSDLFNVRGPFKGPPCSRIVIVIFRLFSLSLCCSTMSSALNLPLISAEMSAWNLPGGDLSLSWKDFEIPLLETQTTASQEERADRQEEVDDCLIRLSQNQTSSPPISAQLNTGTYPHQTLFNPLPWAPQSNMSPKHRRRLSHRLERPTLGSIESIVPHGPKMNFAPSSSVQSPCPELTASSCIHPDAEDSSTNGELGAMSTRPSSFFPHTPTCDRERSPQLVSPHELESFMFVTGFTPKFRKCPGSISCTSSEWSTPEKPIASKVEKREAEEESQNANAYTIPSPKRLTTMVTRAKLELDLEDMQVGYMPDYFDAGAGEDDKAALADGLERSPSPESDHIRGGRLVYSLLKNSASVLPHGLLPSRAEGGRRRQNTHHHASWSPQSNDKPPKEIMESVLLPRFRRTGKVSYTKLDGSQEMASQDYSDNRPRTPECLLSTPLLSASSSSKRKMDDFNYIPPGSMKKNISRSRTHYPKMRRTTANISPITPMKPALSKRHMTSLSSDLSRGGQEPRAMSEDPIAEMESIAPRPENGLRDYSKEEDRIILECWTGEGVLSEDILKLMQEDLVRAGFRARSIPALKWRVRNKLCESFEAKRLAGE